jgi:hypothetical protein
MPVRLLLLLVTGILSLGCANDARKAASAAGRPALERGYAPSPVETGRMLPACAVAPSPPSPEAVATPPSCDELHPEYLKGLSMFGSQGVVDGESREVRAVYTRGYATGRLEAADDHDRWRDEHRTMGCTFGLIEIAKRRGRYQEGSCQGLRRPAFAQADFGGARYARELPSADANGRRAFDLGYAMGFTHAANAAAPRGIREMRSDVSSGCKDLVLREREEVPLDGLDVDYLLRQCDHVADEQVEIYQAELVRQSRERPDVVQPGR